MSVSYFWITVGILFLILEIITLPLEFLFASIGIASILTGIVAHFGLQNTEIQIGLFIFFALAIFFAIKPISKKYLYSKRDLKTNIDNYTGQTAKVIQAINNTEERGRVSIFGEEWNARSTNGETIEAETIVIIEKTENMTLFVRKKSEL